MTQQQYKSNNIDGDDHSVKTVNRVMGPSEWGLILAPAIPWGGSCFFIGVTAREIAPLSIVPCRAAIAAAVLLVVVHVRKERLPDPPAVWGRSL